MGCPQPISVPSSCPSMALILQVAVSLRLLWEAGIGFLPPTFSLASANHWGLYRRESAHRNSVSFFQINKRLVNANIKINIFNSSDQQTIKKKAYGYLNRLQKNILWNLKSSVHDRNSQKSIILRAYTTWQNTLRKSPTVNITTVVTWMLSPWVLGSW